MSKEFKDNTIEISEKVKARIESGKFKLYKRLVKAFPGIRNGVGYDKIKEFKKKIEESKKEIKEKIDNSKREIKEKIDEINKK